jgi:16S rRNA C967 or C1407 C5-methylase (RsmB/RsmF family)
LTYSIFCLVSPDVLSRLSVLEDLGEGSLAGYLAALSNPGPWFYFRVNTLRTSRQALLGALNRGAGNGARYEPDPGVQEAIRISIEGPRDVRPVPGRIEIDRFNAESVLSGGPVYANGIASQPAPFRANDVRAVYHRFTTPWDGVEHDVFCGNGTAIMPDRKAVRVQRGVVFKMTDPWFRTPPFQTTPAFKDGLFFDQVLPSMLVSKALAPKPGERVLDVCCGGGGKTTHLAQLMKNRGVIKAIDRNVGKIQQLQERVDRMGLDCITPITGDATKLKSILGRFSPSKVLVDPPCSALGLRPKLCMADTKRDLDIFWGLQERITRNAIDIMPQGATLVYSTCTVTHEEDERVIARLVGYGDVKIVETRITLGHPGLATDTLSAEETDRLVRFYPHLDETVGFFIAKLEKL